VADVMFSCCREATVDESISTTPPTLLEVYQAIKKIKSGSHLVSVGYFQNISAVLVQMP